MGISDSDGVGRHLTHREISDVDIPIGGLAGDSLVKPSAPKNTTQKVVVPAMWPFRMVMFWRPLPTMTAAPPAGLAVEEWWAAQVRASTSLALTLMDPLVTVTFSRG